MTSMEQVHQVFRLKAREKHLLQFHEIQALSSATSNKGVKEEEEKGEDLTNLRNFSQNNCHCDHQEASEVEK